MRGVGGGPGRGSDPRVRFRDLIRRIPADKLRIRRVRCTKCGRRLTVAVGKGRPGQTGPSRLRYQPSPCCQARMRPVNWRGLDVDMPAELRRKDSAT